ncbi:hypothetical protein LWC35_20045 [Pseudonocardia kujensis]|uniref:hypothetical protein n=1 Tax=Pseudonocardia kujensis TaxID=1128675 RepID=UPI001E65C362|nr:hypothetical protein [Pseudonocardia kujensis]MCE0765174.1 hypothetical protein [Pseudonocardia kujensis]
MAEREMGREPITTPAAEATPAQRVAPPEPPPPGNGPRHGWRRIVTALAMVAIVQVLLALCLVSADQKLEPHNLPFGVTGSSPVTSAVASKLSLTLTSYPNQAAALQAVGNGEIYGAYVPGGPSDMLVIAPQKSFFAAVILGAAFEDAAHKAGRPVTVENAKPLPLRDRTGSVTGLLLLPLLIGGFLVAVFVLKATGRAAARWRVTILLGYSVIGALLTDLIAGPGIGAFSSDRFWPLLPCFILVIAAVAISAAAIQRLAGRLGTLIVVLVFIVLGLASSGGLGLSLLPVYWQTIGTALPPQHAVTLIRNTLYFGGHRLTVPLLVLFAYVIVGTAVLGYFEWFRDARPHPPGVAQDPTTATPPGSTGTSHRRAAAPSARRTAAVAILGALATAAMMQALFSTTYMASGHSPVADQMPVGVVGTSPLIGQVQQQGYSLAVHQYSSTAEAQQAIDQGELFAAVVPGASPATSILLVVPTQSDLAPLDLADQFERAAAATGQQLQVQASEPTPLASGDPYGIVLSIMLAPLLIGGYNASTALMGATATATAPWRVGILCGFAVAGGLLVSLIVGPLLHGYPPGSFWLVWPIAALIIAVVALFASVLQKLLGPVGTLLTVFVVMLLGNPSSGGANGVPYLPGFWRDLGPYLPPRNAYLLLRNTVYFDGHGIAPHLWVLLGYLVAAGVISSLLGWFRTPRSPISSETESQATAMTNAAAAAPP